MAKDGVLSLPTGSPRQAADLVSTLWDIECRHQLGDLTRVEYRQAVLALYGKFGREYSTERSKGNSDG